MAPARVFVPLRALALINLSQAVTKAFLSYAKNMYKDQPGHTQSLISIFVIRCLDIIIPVVDISEI